MTVQCVIRCLMIMNFAYSTYAQAHKESTMLTIQEARLLAHEALPEATKRLPGLTLWLSEEDQARPTNCVTFDVLWSNTGTGSVHVGFWSVDMHTGEVWDEVYPIV